MQCNDNVTAYMGIMPDTVNKYW